MVYLVDVLKFQKWSFPFKVFGRNALFSYVLSIVIVKVLITVFKTEKSNGYAYLYAEYFQPMLGDYPGSLGFALFIVFIVFLAAYALYRKDIMIKL